MSDTLPDPGRDAAPAGEEDDDPLAFDPVALRRRTDGWTPDKQTDFIAALAETGCVEEACRHVKMTPTSAYRLRARGGAASFRLAWEAALDLAISRLSEAAMSRAIYGVPVPHFYKGEQVGEHRRYDERLTMWLLRYRDPVRYGKWLDACEMRQHPEGRPRLLIKRINELLEDCWGLLTRPAPVGPVYPDRLD